MKFRMQCNNASSTDALVGEGKITKTTTTQFVDHDEKGNPLNKNLRIGAFNVTSNADHLEDVKAGQVHEFSDELLVQSDAAATQ